jgi:hypothetical protein
MRFPTRLAALTLVVAPFAAPLQAQAAAPVPTAALVAAPAAPDSTPPAVDLRAIPADTAAAVTAATPQIGAPMTGLRAGVFTKNASSFAQPAMAANHANLGQSRAMMVVGVAGLIVGAIIGGTPGTIIMVGGAVVGLVGLYDYLQ